MQSELRIKKVGEGTGDEAGDEAELEQALRAVRDEPANDSAWQQLEQACEHTDAPELVAEAYLRMLTPSLAPARRRALAQRAHAFHEMWLGDDVEAHTRLLVRVLELDPDTSWALDALVATLTTEERWDELLEAYELALRAELTKERRAQLLGEAAHAAKDFADRPERAVHYLRALFQLEAPAVALAASVARMLEERQLFRPLIALLQMQLATHEAPALLRLEIAELYLERLDEPEAALRSAVEVLEGRPGDEAACALLSRILARANADAALRLRALEQLRRHHQLAAREQATIAALETALDFADHAQQLALRRELSERLVGCGDLARAHAHCAELLRRAPDDVYALAQLERIAERSGNDEAFAQALTSAAANALRPETRASLMVKAMRVHSEQLQQRAPTLALGRDVFALAAAPRALRREAALLMEPLLCDAEQDAERLEVLATLCATEREQEKRRALLAELAQVARRSGDTARALAAWEERLADDADDLEARSACIELCDELARYEVELEHLRQRARIAPTQGQRRQDLARAAELEAVRLQRPDAAIASWLALWEEFGDAPDALSALDELMSARRQFAALAQLYESLTERAHGARLEHLCRLGDISRTELADTAAAVRCYTRALALAPECAPAREGLRELLARGSECAAQVTTALARAYEATDDWRLCVQLLDARLATIQCTKQQARLMLEVAELCELRGRDPSAALSLIAKALTRTPLDGHIERELLRLSDVTGHHREAAVALGYAAAMCLDGDRAAELKTQAARLYERVGDDEAAAAAYLDVLKLRPEARSEAHALVRTAARAGGWQLACEAALRSCCMRCAVEPEVLAQLERTAEDKRAFVALCDAFAAALAQASELPPALGHALELQLAQWYSTRCDDLPSAERAARRAVAHAPEQLAGLLRLSELERRSGSPGLVDTLVALSARDLESEAALHEAARLAIELALPSARQRELLRLLYRRVSALCAARTRGPAGASDPLFACLSWSIEQLVPLELSHGGGRIAVHLLDDAVRLPLPDRERADLGAQCARLLERNGDLAEALRVGLAALDRRCDDLALVRWLARLAAKQQRIPDELSLRKHELRLSNDADRRLELRLEVARLTGVLEAEDGRLSMLRENLDECPGHEASIGAACDLLAERGRFGELSALLTDQAAALEGSGRPERAAPLLRRAAVVAERRLDDIELAIQAHARAADLPGGQSSIEELVRLCRRAGDPVRTAHWLGRQVECADAEARPGLYVERARELLAAACDDAAVDTLLTGFRRHPEDRALRALLIERLRVVGRELDLAEVLAATALLVEDATESAELSREAARLLACGMHDPAALARSAEHALAHFQNDGELSLLLADALRALGQTERARDVLMNVLALFGRRRSPERGLVHEKLAGLLREEGDLGGACEQLELALKMRSRDVNVMHALAELADQAGDLARRERALHALRLAAKRGPIELASGRVIGETEILLQLAAAAEARGDLAHAQGLRESALESLTLGDAECERVKRYLWQQGELALLEQILRRELALEPREVARAARIAHLADVLERRGETPDSVLTLRLEALALDPQNPELHAAAWSTAHACGQRERLRATLEELLMRARARDSYARCELCLRLGDLWREDGELAQALTCYLEAEATGVREGDVCRAQLQLALERGDAQRERALLARLVALGEAELDEESRDKLLYRMAEIRLGSPDTRDEGVAHLREALSRAAQPIRVRRLLCRALSEGPCDPTLLTLLSELARSSSEAELLELGELYVEHGDEALLSALLEPLRDACKTTVHARLRTRRAARLAKDPGTLQLARNLLGEVLAECPDDLEAEDMLLACMERAGEQGDAIRYLRERFTRASADNDAEACARYALSLQSFPAAGEARIELLRRATELCPERAALWRALVTASSAPAQALERARAIERLLALRDAPSAALALEAADTYERAGEHEGVLRVLRGARDCLPGNALIERRLLETVRAQNDPAALAQLLEQLARAEHDGERALALFQEATSLWRERLDDLGATVATLEAAVAALPRQRSLRSQLAAALRAVGRDEDALLQLTHAIDGCSDQHERAGLLHTRGRALLDQGRLLDGIEDLERASQLCPEVLDDTVLDLAQAACERAAQRHDTSAARSCAHKLSAVRCTRGELVEAATLLEASLAHAPQDEPVLARLTELYCELKRPEQLAQVCMKRLTLATVEPPSAAARQLSQLLPELAEPREALAALARAHAHHPDCAEIEQALFDAHLALSDHVALAELWMARGRRAGESSQRVDCWHQAGKHLLASGATESALPLLQGLKDAHPEYVEVTLTLAETLLAEKRHPEARELLTTALARRPEVRPTQRARLLVLLSRVARAAGELDEALRSMQLARETDKTNRTIVAELAILAEELAAWPVAERALTALLLIKNSDVMARSEMLLRRARVALQLSGPAQALMWARRAEEAEPKSEEVAALIATLQRATGDSGRSLRPVRPSE